MTIELELRRFDGEQPEATVVWDPETGEITGPVAGLIRGMADEAREAGSVVTHPYPTEYLIEGDPLQDRASLALVLSQQWVVPGPLKDAFPEQLDDEEEQEPDVDLLY